MLKSIGAEALSSGKGLEHRYIGALTRRGWIVQSGPLLDYTQKTDMCVTCPSGNVFNIQISLTGKSKQASKRLANRGISVICGDTTTRDVGNFVCNRICTVSSDCCPFNILDSID